MSGALILAMLITCLVGCGGNAASNQGEASGQPASSGTNSQSESGASSGDLAGEITFWHCFTQGVRMEAVQAAAESFMVEHPNVKINIETMSWGDFNTKWKAGITTGDLPDMSIAQNTGEVAEMLNAQVLARESLLCQRAV